MCESYNLRLCSLSEVLDECHKTGCSSNRASVWSRDTCGNITIISNTNTNLFTLGYGQNDYTFVFEQV